MTAPVAELLNAVNDVLEISQSTGIQLSAEQQNQIAQILNSVADQLESQLGEQLPEAPLPAPQIPEQARLLWILAGGDPTTFAQYARQFPSDELNQLATNPAALNNLIANLQNQMPQGRPGQADGIPEAGLQSSNIYGFQYDPRTGKLKVRFQEGNVYEYDNVPPAIYQIFANGAHPAKTKGQNKYGKWWVGKEPSLGSAFYMFVRNGGFPYKRLK